MPQSITTVKWKDAYAPALSEIICHNFTQVNSKDYPPHEIASLVASHTPTALIHMVEQGEGLVALCDGSPVGMLRITPDTSQKGAFWIGTVFVSPDHHGSGIGRRLMDTAHTSIKAQGGHTVYLGASITAHRFYHTLGYQYRGACDHPDDHGVYPMEKHLD